MNCPALSGISRLAEHGASPAPTAWLHLSQPALLLADPRAGAADGGSCSRHVREASLRHVRREVGGRATAMFRTSLAVRLGVTTPSVRTAVSKVKRGLVEISFHRDSRRR